MMCREEDDEEPTSKEGSAPAEGTDVRPAKVPHCNALRCMFA